MEEITIVFQSNPRPRDYIYEISTLYLVARCIHIAAKMRLFEKISPEGISIARMVAYYPQYQEEALHMLLDNLIAYGILSFNAEKVYPTSLANIIQANPGQFSISKDDWRQSFNIVNYLNQNKTVMANFSADTSINVNNNHLRITSTSAQRVVFELTYLHLLARSLHFATAKHVFTYLQTSQQPVTIDELYRKIFNSTYENDNQSASGFSNLIQLLSRYQLIHYHPEEKMVNATPFCQYLLQHHQESIFYAMLKVDERWWNAAASFKKGMKKNTVSAYELTNTIGFYRAIHEQPHYFPEGMAAISLFDDKNVMEASHHLLEQHTTIVDIGGGKGGLLKAFHQKFGEQKRYILYEKDTEGLTKEDLAKEINAKSKSNAVIDISLGDFTKDASLNNIPKLDNALYFIKCVLHNLNKEKSITVLRNVRLAMGNNCQLFLAERIVPDSHQRKPHLNNISKLLMLMLFKEAAHDIKFYQEVLSAAGFELNSVLPAGNYYVFSATEKPALRLQKYQQITATPAVAGPSAFWRQSEILSAAASDTTAGVDAHAVEKRPAQAPAYF